MEKVLAVQSQTGTVKITSLSQQGALRAAPHLETSVVQQGTCNSPGQGAKERRGGKMQGWDSEDTSHVSGLVNMKRSNHSSAECRLCRDFISRRVINRLGILRRGKMQLMSITHSIGEISGIKKRAAYSYPVPSVTCTLQALGNTSADCRGGIFSSRKRPISWSKAYLFPKARHSQQNFQ